MRDLVLKGFKNDNGRIVTLSDEIYEGSYLNFKKDLYDIISSDEQVVSDNFNELRILDDSVAEVYLKNLKYDPIYIDICSDGGSVYHALGMYDLLRSISRDTSRTLIARVSGVVASAATIVMLGCDTRVASKHTSFLIHSVSALTIGKIEEIKEELAEIDRLSNITKEIYLERTNFSADKLDEIDKMKTDLWISAKEAKDVGLVQDII